MKKILLAIAVVASLVSCNDYLDVNDNPNSVPFESVEPQHLLSGAQLRLHRIQNVTMNELGNVFMNSWAGNVNSFTGGYAREFQLNIDNSFYNGIWDGLYAGIYNLQLIIDFPNANGSQNNYIAAAKILKAHYMQYLLDLYGDLPYTEAFKGQLLLNPKYNDDQYVYRQLIAELESARQLIDADDVDAISMTSRDIMLAGDMTKWRKLANTIELRMLMRMSNIQAGDAVTYRDTKLAEISVEDFLDANVKINPGFTSATDSQMNPFLASYLIDATGYRLSNYQFVCASRHIADFMNGAVSTEIVAGSGVNYPGVADPRRSRIWKTSSGLVRGITQGATSGSPLSISSPSALGITYFNPYNQVAGISSSFAVYSSGNTALLPMAAVDGYVVTKSEAEFLLAEAAVRYPALFSDAQTHFNEGVKESFLFSGLTASAATTYLTNIASKPFVGWTGSTTDAQKVSAIMTQKWIALTGVNALESFIDYNRTGYPVTPLALTAGQANKPKRLIYPLSEYVANSANVPNIAISEAFAVNSRSPFWLQTNPVLGN